MDAGLKDGAALDDEESAHSQQQPQQRGAFFPVILDIDPRAVALFRLGLGLCALSEWWLAVDYREAFLYDTGVLPRSTLSIPRSTHSRMHPVAIEVNPQIISYEDGISILHSAGSPEGVMILLTVQLIVTACFILGFWSRLSATLTFMFVNSWNIRLQTKGFGGIEVLLIFLFWSIIVPSGGCYTMDKYLQVVEKVETKFERGPCEIQLQQCVGMVTALRDGCVSFGIPLHLAVMYYSSGVSKWRTSWENGMAVYFVTRTGAISNPTVANFLSGLPTLCWFLARFTVWIESYVGVLLLLPFQSTRMLALVLLIPFHMGMHLTLNIGSFSPTMMSALLLLAPSSACDWLEKRVLGMWWEAGVRCCGSRRRAIVRWNELWRVVWLTLHVIGIVLLALAAVLTAITVRAQMCGHLGGYVRSDADKCWSYRWGYVPAFSFFSGPPQHHTPFMAPDSSEVWYHFVGVLRQGDAIDLISLFDDRGFVFDGQAWDPKQHIHVNHRISKYVMGFNVDTTERRARGSPHDLVQYLCSHFAAAQGGTALESAALFISTEQFDFPGRDSDQPLSKQVDTLLHLRCDGMPVQPWETTHFRAKWRDQGGMITSAVPIAERSSVTVFNHGRRAMTMVWIDPSTQTERVKGTVPAGGKLQFWTQLGHAFRLYWTSPENIEEEKEGVYHGSHDGAADLSILVDRKQRDYHFSEPVETERLPTKYTFAMVNGHADVAIETFWVRPGSGKEVSKGVVLPGVKWKQSTEFGHRFNFYMLDDSSHAATPRVLLQSVNCVRDTSVRHGASLVSEFSGPSKLEFELLGKSD